MKWVARLVVGFGALIGLVAAAGWMLPVGHEASRSTEFNRPPAEVFALITDQQNYSTWWAGDSVKSEVVENMPPFRFVTRIVGETSFGGTWTFDIRPTAGGSRLTITERGEIYNVVFRALARFVFGYTGTMDSFLAAARQRLK